MPSPKNIYGLFDPRRSNPNVTAVLIAFLATIAILVLTGRHSKISLYKLDIETNIPSPNSGNADTSHSHNSRTNH